MSNLKHIQKWVQGVITHPEGIVIGAHNTPINGKKLDIDTVVKPSKGLTSKQRIGIYHNSYFARLIECFKSEFNGLLNALGVELFEHLTWCYLQEHPSSSYTLNQLGKRFPEYLENTLHKSTEKGNQPDSWQLFIVDMAKFERTYTEVFSGVGHEKYSTTDISNTASLTLSPAVVCLQLQFQISKCIGQFRENETGTIPNQKSSNYVFTRQQYRVKVHLLDNNEWSALQNWIQNPSEKCAVEYQSAWRSKGIGYS